ncbi:hypothetical protein C3F09_11995 [candidate division GN15 bacterium]|uniref:Uncharacterized protein n=1 Tax=candidate division GN15 bacterium TaxID=2072418 RepID=A0A855WXP2_9BACT|nr:MAG: hypothetical protein C3F09_11995 [candidate division GN15 bacterium]
MWLLLPTRNKVGNPKSESLIQQCGLPSGAGIVRLYLGDGGATTAFWYTVTLDDGPLSFERQIFFSYSEPDICSIECMGDSILLNCNFWTEPKIAIPLSEAKTTLRQRPIVYYRGKLMSAAEFDRSWHVQQYVVGVYLIICALFLLIRGALLIRWSSSKA